MMASKTIDMISLASSDPKFLDSVSKVVKQSEEADSVFLGKKVEADGIFELFTCKNLSSIVLS
jgi:hypothetical protein